MNEFIIAQHNALVGKGDVVYHLGDFTFNGRDRFLRRLKGSHVFLRGNHDHKRYKDPEVRYIKVEGQRIVLCHYAMRVWAESHYGSWQLYGHSHGTLPPVGKQLDVGVDTNGFKPYSFDDIKSIIDSADETYNSFVLLPGVLDGTMKE